MAWTLVASAIADGTTSSIDTTGADLLVAVVAGNVDPLTVSDNKSNTWTGLTQQTQSGSLLGRLFYVRGGTVGTGHTFDAGASFRTVGVLAFSGSATSPFDQQNGATGSSALSTGSITPTEDNELVIAGWALGNDANTFSVSGSFTVQVANTAVSGVTYGAALAYLIQTTAAAANPALTWSGGGASAAMIASFKMAASASTRGVPFGSRGTAFNGGRTFLGNIRRAASGLFEPRRDLITSRNDPRWSLAA